MTTSRQTNWMDFPRIRRLVDEANTLSLAERVTLVKGLIPGIRDQLTDREYEGFLEDIRLKGARFEEAKTHPGQGRAARIVPGEREVEGRG
jgi:hypothetical protein